MIGKLHLAVDVIHTNIAIFDISVLYLSAVYLRPHSNLKYVGSLNIFINDLPRWNFIISQFIFRGYFNGQHFNVSHLWYQIDNSYCFLVIIYIFMIRWSGGGTDAEFPRARRFNSSSRFPAIDELIIQKLCLI